ncbi:MAG: thiol-disulfide isomerase, partial [Acidobacteria bacterium]|nr:thiol-disulfide isomerase [Acidobacteriota bacterium]
MPPWHADPHVGKFINDRRLTQAEIDTLAGWAESGAKEGDPKDAPKPVEFAEGWTIGEPDVVIDMGADYTVQASGTIEYTYFVAPAGFTEDKWIEKIEVRPGKRSVVHHVVLFARPPGSKFVAEAKPGAPYVPSRRDPPPGSQRPSQGDRGVLYGLTGANEMISTYVPGGHAYVTKPGQGRLVRAGSDLVFQMHYTANGRQAVDRTRVGIVFSKEPPRERVVNTFIMNGSLRIPPGAAEHRVDARVVLHEDVKLQSLFPHMHLRGKAFEYRATVPGGETRMLLRVPKYDFNWQMTYLLDEPLLLPKGTQLEATAWYDNSPNNPHNPDSKAEVLWGDQSWDEMLAGFVDLAIPVDMNPVDIARPKPRAVQSAEAR